MYAATTKDEGNTADGRFSTACKTITFFPAGMEEVLSPFSQILNAMPHPKRVIFFGIKI
jgi:hypothetical protein